MPVGWEEVSTNDKKQIATAMNILQECYQFAPHTRGSDNLRLQLGTGAARRRGHARRGDADRQAGAHDADIEQAGRADRRCAATVPDARLDRKSTRLNSSH